MVISSRHRVRGEEDMLTLVLNCGGSSVKYQLVEMPAEKVIARGDVQRIGSHNADFRQEVRGKTILQRTLPVADHSAAIGLALETLAHPEHGVIEDFRQIDAVGHRVVHGGEKCTGSLLVTKQVIDVLKEFYDLAPLHNPPNVEGIEACSKLMPKTPQVAVFDSSLHQTVPARAHIYAIPYEYYEKHRVRRYGFHGITFRYMTNRAAELLNRPLEDLKIVNLMLGSGTTACAFKNGKSVDVSTGLTPTEGLIQSTRSGDLDPLVVTYLMRQESLDADAVDLILNRESGWFGISGVSSDLRDVLEASESGHARAKLAVDAFAYRTKKYIGAYAAAMGGIDVLIFSGGVGERSPEIREAVCQDLEFLGIQLDAVANYSEEVEKNIAQSGSSVDVLVIPTDEEIVIARDTFAIVRREGYD